MSDQNAELRSVVVAEAIRNHLLIVVFFALAGFALGYFAANRGEERSTATTPILVNPLEGNPYYPTRTGELLTNLLTEAQAVRSDGVAALAAEQLGNVEDPAVLLSGLGVTTPVNTQILEIAYTHTDPDVALRRSQAIAEVYLDYRRMRAENRIAQQTGQLDAQIEPLTQQIADVGTQLEAAEPDSAEAQLLLTQITGLEEQRGLLQTRRSELAATPTDPGQVITPASLDASGLLSSKLLLPIAGTIFGFACGVIVAMLRSRANLSLRDAQDVRDLGVVVLGTLGGVDAVRDGVAGAQILDDQYRKIRVAVLALEKRRPFSLVVASAREDVHSPGAAVDLAIYFARAGLETILIDATEHGDGPAHVLAPDDRTGLTEVLLGNTMLTSALTPVAPMLWVLAPGNHVAGMSDLFVSGEMAELLARAKQRSDVVIVASGSIQHAEGQSLASMSDAIIVEVEEDRTTRTEVARARQTLDVLPCALLGAIYVGGDVKRRARGFRPVTTMDHRRLRTGSTQAELSAAPSAPVPTETAGDDGDRWTATAGDDDDRWTATATYDPELRAWVVDAGEHTDPAIPAEVAKAKKATAGEAVGAASAGDPSPDPSPATEGIVRSPAQADAERG